MTRTVTHRTKGPNPQFPQLAGRDQRVVERLAQRPRADQFDARGQIVAHPAQRTARRQLRR